MIEKTDIFFEMLSYLDLQILYNSILSSVETKIKVLKNVEFVYLPVTKLLWLLFEIIKDTKIKVKIHRELKLDGVWGQLNKKWIFSEKVGQALLDKQKNSSKTACYSKDTKNWAANIHMFWFIFWGRREDIIRRLYLKV